MTQAQFQIKMDYYTDLLGIAQVKTDEAIKWGYELYNSMDLKKKKAFIYLNTLSRFNPESSNTISEQQTDFIFTQLEKLLP